MLKIAKDLSQYKVLKKTGVGPFEEVYKIEEKETGTIFAAKVSINELKDKSDSTIKNIKQGLNILSKLNHLAVLKFIGFSSTNFNNENKPVIITELMQNGSLDDILSINRTTKALLPIWTDTKKIINIYGIASAMSYLHKHHIIHKNLKPSNILMDDYLFPKVSDFCFSKINHSNFESVSDESFMSSKSDLFYIAPETWSNGEYLTSSDVYSFAFILYEIITDSKPELNCKPNEIPKKVVRGMRPQFVTEIPRSYQKLIEKCW